MFHQPSDGKILLSKHKNETNTYTKAVNGPLQQRMTVLNSDFRQASTLPSDYENRFGILIGRNSVRSSSLLSFSSTTFIQGLDAKDDSTSLTSEQRRNLAYQKQVARQVTEQMNELTTLLSQGLNIHLNIGQQFNMKTPAVFMFLETLSPDALMNKELQFVDNARVRFPSTGNRSVNGTKRTSLRVCFFFLLSLR